MKKCSAFTLMECLFCLAIVGILAGWGMGQWQIIVEKIQSDRVRTEVIDFIQYAEHLAAIGKQTIIWCQSRDQAQCSDPPGEFHLFFALTPAREEKKIISIKQIPGKLYWRTFPLQAKRNYLYFRPQLLKTSNSTIWYCRDNKVDWAIFLSKTGRMRVVDSPNDEVNSQKCKLVPNRIKA